MKPPTGRVDDERGLTLTELLITVVLMGLIMAPLSNAAFGFFRITDMTNQRLNESHDIQLAAAYFAQDVQSVGVRDWSAYPFPPQPSVEGGVPYNSGLFPCGDPGTPPAAIRFAWDDPPSPTGAPTKVTVAYLVWTIGGEKQLRRITCRNGSTAPDSDIVVAHNVDSARPLPIGADGVITLRLEIRDPANTDVPVTVDLQGQRRQT